MVAPITFTMQEVVDRLASKHGITIQRETWRRYVSRGDAPEPSKYVGRTPLWTATVVDTWAKSRPGRGAGGGRPARVPQQGGETALPPAVAVSA